MLLVVQLNQRIKTLRGNMSQTKQGGLKTRHTNLNKYGADFYKDIGRIGGEAKNPKKGFGTDNRTLLEKLRGVPKRASVAGTLGGKNSKRGKAKV